MKSLQNKVAVITGAASGIGRELALQLAKDGCVLALTDTNRKGLLETRKMITGAGGTAGIYPADVSKAAQVDRFARDVLKKYKQVDILINNAGVTLFGRLDDLEIKDLEWIIDINFWGMVYMTRAFLPALRKQKDSHLVNISSIFGTIGVSSQTAYCASKFAVRGFTESLQRELKSSTVSVSCVYPGGIRTNIARNARFKAAKGQNINHEGLAKHFDKMARTSPQEAARIIIDGMKKDRRRILVGVDAKIIALIQRLFPVKYAWIMDKIFG